ncbi:predicted protein, partial [Nematostella vectensis]
PVRVAIIGAGIGGSASAFFTRELLGSSAEIDVYEASNRVGGRLDTVEVAGQRFEAGGSIIHSANQHMQSFVSELGDNENSSLLGIYNGTAFVFMGSRWKIVNYAKLIWRYGFDLITMDNWISKMLKKFGTIYTLQNEGKCFTSVQELLKAMGGDEFIAMTKTTTRDELKKLGMKDRTIDELVTTVTRVNYGQDTSLNAFAGSVALAGTGGSLWAVQGGNYQVCEGLLQKSQVTLYKETKIKEIAKNPGKKSPIYTLTSDKGVQKSYDVVIIAAPLDIDTYYLSCPKCSSWPKQGSPGAFWQTIANFYSTPIDYKHFGLASMGDVPEFIGTTKDSKNYFNSIGAQFPVDGDKPKMISVRKVFSRELLTADQKRDIFPTWKDGDSKTVPWLAYPDLKPAEHFSSFVLDDGVFYVNAIEHAASAMEMSAVSARNAALLA